MQRIQLLQEKLKKDYSHASPIFLQKIESGLQWLEHLETLQNHIKAKKTKGAVDFITFWNQLDRRKSPSTLHSHEALKVRDGIALNATSVKSIQNHLSAFENIKQKLIYELEALDRIERYRRRDLIITIKDGEGNPIQNAEIELAQMRHLFLFGCNIYRWENEQSEKQVLYRKRFADLLNFATLGFYWAAYERRQGTTLEEERKLCAQWCRANDITPKGHPLVWNYSDPRWLPDDPEKVLDLQLDRVEREVEHFKGQIHIWDVVNEVTAFNRKSFWERSPKLTKMWAHYGQMEVPKRAFETARESNPNAILILNDYYIKNLEQAQNDQSIKGEREGVIYEDVINAMVDGKKKKLYDVIGIQSHMHHGAWSTQHIIDVIDRFAVFNVPLHFTETTIVSGERKDNRKWGETTREGERIQAEEVERFYRTVFSKPEVEALTWWDFSDDRAWQGAPAGLVRKDMSPKPAYNRLMSLIKDEWWTNVKKQVKETPYHTRGFMGEYCLHVKLENGKEATKRFVLKKGQKAKEITIVVK